MMLIDLWHNLTSTFTSNTILQKELWTEIEVSYSGKKRYYHNLAHLKLMFRLANEYKSQIVDFEVLAFSIFYHDVVYNSLRSDNESKSADFAQQHLLKMDVPVAIIDKVNTQILATKHHQSSDCTDTNFLLDIDLAILGSAPDKYQEYVLQIRKEYAVYPDLVYNVGRRKVLQSFLAQPSIYKTPLFIAEFEQNAKVNIAQELDSLTLGKSLFLF